MTLQAIIWDNGRLEILDQTLLPETTRSILISGVEDGWRAINKMQVTPGRETGLVRFVRNIVRLRLSR